MLAPLPVAEPERLVNLAAPGPKPGSVSCNEAGGCDEVFSYPMYRDLQRAQEAFTDIAAHQTDRVHLSYGGRSASVWASCVSGSYFPTLGLRPAAGRLFGREVDEPVGGQAVAEVVPAGSFRMGCVSGQDCFDDELPVHEVRVTSFALGRNEVLFEEYDRFVAATAASARAIGAGAGAAVR